MFFIFITCPVPSCFASSTRPSCKSSTLCFAPSRVATTLCTGPEFYIYLFFMFYLFFIYNMLSSRICWSLRALGLLAKADPLSASRRLESLPLFVQAPNFSVYIYLFTFIYLYLCFCFFITCPVPSCWSLRALGLLAKADPLSASRRLESLHLFVQALPSLRI